VYMVDWSPGRLYKIVSTGPIGSPTDTDEDGLTDSDETGIHGTDPLVADSDTDGLGDGAEVNTHSTNPLVADSDTDGLSDGAEVNTHSTNPLVADSDTDGLGDGAEVNTHSTNPLDADSDDGGRSDGDEVLVDFTNPLDGADDFGNTRLLPGDGNQDGTIDLSDGISFLNWFFLGIALPLASADSELCLIDPVNATAVGLQVMDWNGDVTLDLSDATGLLTWFFTGTAEHVLGQECIVVLSGACNSSCVDSP
jgi:hypothetical protein